MILDTRSDPVQTWTLDNPATGYDVTEMASGDLTGDGTGELLIPLIYAQVGDDLSVGAVYMLNDYPVAATTDFTEGGPLITGVGANDSFGYGPLVQDVNGDGQDDLIVAARTSADGSLGPGRLHVFFGPLQGPLTAVDADLIISGDYPGAMFGSEVAAADFDGDGLIDLAVGAPSSFEAYDFAGKVYLFDGRDLWP